MMKLPHLLYLCTKEEPFILKILSSRYSVHVYHVGIDRELENQQWNLVIFQDADVWQRRLFQKLKKFPWLFISTCNDIHGYVSPKASLFGVLNIGGANLSLWGIPKELQLCLRKPVEKIADYYFFEQEPKVCRIVYCPTGNSVCENDFILLSFIQKTNAVLTIVSDQYQTLATAFPAFVEVVPQRCWLSAFKKAHIVIASGYNAVCAMALTKPCVVLGNCGLGGMVTTANFAQLQSVYFSGRKGACIGEIVPVDLLEVEIRKVFWADCKEMMQVIRKKVWDIYGFEQISGMLLKELERITVLATIIKSKNKRFSLKPFRSSVFKQEEIGNKLYLMRGMQCFGELDEEMSHLLDQCNGSASIGELIESNCQNKEGAIILWENLYELWKEKLILFKL